MNQRNRWLGLILCFIVGDAILLQLRGALLVNFQATFQVSEGLLGLVAPAGTLGFVLAVLFSGILAGYFDIKRFMIVATAFVSCATLVASGSLLYAMLLAMLLLQGVALGVFRGVDRLVLSHLFPASRGRIFNVYSLAWAAGAASAPLLVNVGLSVGDWRLIYLVCGLYFLPLVWLLWHLEIPDSVGNEERITTESLFRTLRNPPILGMCATMLLFGGVEGSFFTWLPYYAGQFYSQSTANLLFSAFFLSYIPGRVFYGWVVEHVEYLDLLVPIAVVSIPIIYVLFSGTTGPVLFAAVALMGFLIAGFFPTLSAYGVEIVPEFSGPINALSTASAYTGIVLVPAIIGLLAGRYGLQPSLLILTVPMAVGGALLLVLRRGHWEDSNVERDSDVQR